MKKTLSIIGIILFFFAIWTALIPDKSESNSNGAIIPDTAHEQQYVADAMKEHEQQVNARISAILNNIEQTRQLYLARLAEAMRSYGAGMKEVEQLYSDMKTQNEENVKTVSGIIDKYGWLGENRIGPQNSYTLFTVMQSADFTTQEKYTSLMEKAVKEGTLSPQHFAQFVDRRALIQHQQQIYGTQLRGDMQSGKYSFAPIADEEKVNERRFALGLPALEQYALENNVDWKRNDEG
jgi:hypothetical protein